MVSIKTKARYSGGKLSKAAGKILPIFARESVSDLADEILRDDEYIRKIILTNPGYRKLLEEKTAETFKKYKGVIYGSKVVDSWDRVTSALGLVADAAGPFSGGLGNIISGVEEIGEGIPKGLYAIYYVTKTGDYKALPLWGAVEGLSLIPGLGDAIDMTNIYVNRARKITKDKIKKDFKKHLSLVLEKRAA